MAKGWNRADESVEPTGQETAGPTGQETVTAAQMLELVREMFANKQDSEDRMADLMSKVIAKSHEPWYDERKFPHMSAFNPLGEKDHPRPELTRVIYWLGFPLHKEELTREEIELMNELRPGKFHLLNHAGGVEKHNYFTVRELEPGMPNSPLLVVWPCSDPADRSRIERFDRQRGAVDLLRECLLPHLKNTEEPVAEGVG